jgi:hypothetical protein
MIQKQKDLMTRTIFRPKRERGFTIVAFSLMIFVSVGFTGLAVDAGYLQLQKHKIQIAADAAAMGALREMEKGNTDLTAAGQNDSSYNGFTNGQNNTTVTVSNPPTSGAYSGQATAVQATVTRVVPTYFMRALGTNSMTISATAVAQTSTSHGSIGGCIFAMNPTASGAFTITGNVTISTACSAVVKSTSATAFSMVGNSTFNLYNSAEVGVVGTGTTGWSLSGGAQIWNASTNASESPVNVQTFNDPLAGVAAPSPSGLIVRSNSTLSVSPNATVTLNPGIYCGGMDLKGTVTFNTGTYILAGGGLNINSQATVSDTGTGEMFYNTSSNSQAWGCPGGPTAAGSMTFNGGASINLIGLTVHDGAGSVGVLFFDDRSTSGLSHKINGNSTSTFDGAMYFLPNALDFAGTNRTPGFLYIVADTISMHGNANLGSDHSSLESVYTLAPSATGGGLVQ